VKRKALLIGALPQSHEGPWVGIADAREWRVDSRDNYCGEVVVEVLANGGPPSRFPLTGGETTISGDKARAVISDRIGAVPVRRITVNIEAL
jgi:hypothetical protein